VLLQAYMLNPAIYSAHLKLHPLMVLSTLVVAEHNMGVWGLLLAVPMTVFALDYLIRYPQSTVTEVGAKELEKVRLCCEEVCLCCAADRCGVVGTGLRT
jgi:predicted PurR-regulated permease PerM